MQMRLQIYILYFIYNLLSIFYLSIFYIFILLKIDFFYPVITLYQFLRSVFFFVGFLNLLLFLLLRWLIKTYFFFFYPVLSHFTLSIFNLFRLLVLFLSFLSYIFKSCSPIMQNYYIPKKIVGQSIETYPLTAIYF